MNVNDDDVFLDLVWLIYFKVYYSVTMPTTAKELCDCCSSYEIPSFPVLTEYFGNALTSGDGEDITIVFGVY